jgi:tetratricopeptide (TPR) repeat protein
MKTIDMRGLELSGASALSLSQYETAVRQLNLFTGDPVASVDAALSETPDFVMAHALRAYLHLIGTEPAGVPIAYAAFEAAGKLSPTEREAGHLTAISHLINGRWSAASRVLEDVAIAYPRDLLALQVGHQIDFFRGDARMLRDRIARALPQWSPLVPGYHTILGMRAFGLEEMGEYAEAERAGRLAVQMEPRDSWAQHAVAHVLEMQGRQREGIAWMESNTDDWSRDNFLAIHNWWHLALYYLDLGQVEKVLALFDGPIFGARSGVIMDLVDASAMLWRLHLRGIDVGDRWDAVADAWEPVADASVHAFNDMHAMMAFVGAGRRASQARLIEAQTGAMMAESSDNAMFTRDVGRPVALALQAFGEGRYIEAMRQLRRVRNIANRAGGSHAQRDVLDLTLIEAAFRSGQHALAKALSAERAAARPTSPLAQLFVQRAAGMKMAA